MRKKKFGETQIEKMDGQLENIERMVIGKQVFTADKMDTWVNRINHYLLKVRKKSDSDK